MNSKSIKGGLKRTLAAVLLLVFVLSQSAFADKSTANQAIMDARSGVLFVEWGIVNKKKEFTAYAVGSAFIINENTLLTCYHVCHAFPSGSSDPEVQEAREFFKKKYGKDWEKHVGLRVALANGTYIGITESLGNDTVDFSIVTVDRPISAHKYLPLRKEEVVTSESVAVLGFPYSADLVREGTATKYSFEDVNVTSGIVSNSKSPYNGINRIQHSAITSGGNSGGPLVDTEGNVVGIHQGTDPLTGEFGYAIDINQVILSLDQLGIEYEKAEDTEPVIEDDVKKTEDGSQEIPVEQVDTSELERLIDEASGKNESDYTAKSWAPFKIALDGAKELNAESQSDVEGAVRALRKAMDELVKKGPNYVLIGGGAAAVVVVIGLIIALTMTKKKSGVSDGTDAGFSAGTEPDPSFAQVRPTRDTTQPKVQPQPDFESTSVLDSGSGGTDALFGSSFEETVLIGKPYAVLKRKSNQEEVTASAENFVIGKDRRKADYCVDGNKSISRSHAKLVNDNGRVYIVDLGSTNGTYVNGVKCSPNTAVPVNSGDRLTLANEEFEIRLL